MELVIAQEKLNMRFWQRLYRIDRFVTEPREVKLMSADFMAPHELEVESKFSDYGSIPV